MFNHLYIGIFNKNHHGKTFKSNNHLIVSLLSLESHFDAPHREYTAIYYGGRGVLVLMQRLLFVFKFFEAAETEGELYSFYTSFKVLHNYIIAPVHRIIINQILISFYTHFIYRFWRIPFK